MGEVNQGVRVASSDVWVEIQVVRAVEECVRVAALEGSLEDEVRQRSQSTRGDVGVTAAIVRFVEQTARGDGTSLTKSGGTGQQRRSGTADHRPERLQLADPPLLARPEDALVPMLQGGPHAPATRS